jgi:uncharacterized membrane protein (UPF0127 family)
MKTLAIAAALLLSVSGCAGAASSGATVANGSGCEAGKVSPASEAGLDQVNLCIQSGKKNHSFTVEVARTGQQQAQGMMFRTELADNKGMLFPFPDARMASFWMKNTLIPLDIIFVAGDGRIVNIAVNATPYSQEPEILSAGNHPRAAKLLLALGLFDCTTRRDVLSGCAWESCQKSLHGGTVRQLALRCIVRATANLWARMILVTDIISRVMGLAVG